ncbi:MAG: hypothetical protein ACYSUT_06110 [Planctomycetota bacterium]|jgi:uncharacterized protein YdeI (BOF family)
MKKTLITITLVLSIALVLTGCSKKGAEAYGDAIANRQITELKQVLTTPADYQDQTITLEGKIVRQCPTGCWFDIQADTAIVHVDINPSGFAIPQKPGKTVLVEGTVKVDGDQVEVIGKGVEIK